MQLQPLVDPLKAEMLTHRVLHADETPLAMLKPASLRYGRIHRAYLWAYATGAFESTPEPSLAPGRAEMTSVATRALMAAGVSEVGCLVP